MREAYETLIGETSWTIWVGRRIKLCDDDPDGSQFVEDLLDTIFTEDDGLWITYMEPGGFWVTRPKEGPELTEIREVVEVADEYDVWSGEEDDCEPSVASSDDWNRECEAESTSNEASDCESTWWSDDSENEAESEEDEVGGDVEVNEAVEGNKDEPAL